MPRYYVTVEQTLQREIVVEADGAPSAADPDDAFIAGMSLGCSDAQGWKVVGEEAVHAELAPHGVPLSRYLDETGAG